MFNPKKITSADLNTRIMVNSVAIMSWTHGEPLCKGSWYEPRRSVKAHGMSLEDLIVTLC